MVLPEFSLPEGRFPRLRSRQGDGVLGADEVPVHPSDLPWELLEEAVDLLRALGGGLRGESGEVNKRDGRVRRAPLRRALDFHPDTRPFGRRRKEPVVRRFPQRGQVVELPLDPGALLEVGRQPSAALGAPARLGWMRRDVGIDVLLRHRGGLAVDLPLQQGPHAQPLPGRFAFQQAPVGDLPGLALQEAVDAAAEPVDLESGAPLDLREGDGTAVDHRDHLVAVRPDASGGQHKANGQGDREAPQPSRFLRACHCRSRPSWSAAETR